MFLRIASKGEAQVESFTVLGASSARGQSDKIGQFGSGAKHAILCALRERLQLQIFCGKTKIIPQTQPQVIHGTMQERVCFRIDSKLEQSSMTLDFGSLDWKEGVPMLLREFISNALDSANGDWYEIIIDYAEKPRAKAGWTQIFVELTDSVRQYVLDLSNRFLHVEGKQSQQLLPQEPGPCKFYRKGVLVHTVEVKSLYSYNCGDELPIDESRNLDSHRVRVYAAKIISRNESAIRHVLRLLSQGQDDFYEADFSYYALTDAAVASAFYAEFGDNAVVANNPVTASHCRAKGLECVVIQKEGWNQAIRGGGVRSGVDLLSRAESEGLQFFDASDELLDNAFAIWAILEKGGFVGSKEFPEILRQFQSPLNGGVQLCGYCDRADNGVYIHSNCVGNWKTILEELSHYITEAGDASRDFQDFAFRVAAFCMKGGN